MRAPLLPLGLLSLGLFTAALPLFGCSADSTPRSSVAIPPAASDAKDPSTHDSAPRSKTAKAAKGEWRVITDVVSSPLGFAWCPFDKDSCEQAFTAGPDHRLHQVRSAPDRQAIGFFVDDQEGCQIFLCADTSCGHPVGANCNPNNGTLKWLPSGSLLYRGGAGSGVSVAMLFSHDGGSLWASEHVMDELSPSQRYLLVGSSSKQELFGKMDIVEVVSLEGASPAVVETVNVPSGADVRAAWLGDRVTLTWATTTKEIKLLDAGTPKDDGEGRPFSR